jgi:hypothetical protein
VDEVAVFVRVGVHHVAIHTQKKSEGDIDLQEILKKNQVVAKVQKCLQPQKKGTNKKVAAACKGRDSF